MLWAILWPVSQSFRGWREGGDRPAAPGRRAGDAERDATVARLSEASSRGELDPVEFDDRLGAALRATYIDELDTLTADLRAPSSQAEEGASARTARRPRPFWRRVGFQYHALPYVMVNGMLVAIWAVTGHGFFWPLFPMAGWGIGLGMHGLVAFNVSSTAPHSPRLPPTVSHGTLSLGGVVTGPTAGPPLSRPDVASRPGPGLGPPARPLGLSTAHVAVLFIDMVDSTGFNERLGDAAWNTLRTRYLHIMRDCVASQGGTEVSTQGDGLFARFDLPASAVAAAVAVQKRADAEQASSPPSPLLRVGIHAGQVIEDGDDLIGNMVNLAARLTAEAEPGQILVTESVADLAGEMFSFEDRGLRQLRGLSRPRHVLAVCR